MINFSFIIPTHNSSGYIKTMLDSIPLRSDIQVLIVDDHSADYGQLKRVVEKHKLKDVIELVQSSMKQSAGAARNQGIDRSIGRWLIFADSDDRFSAGLNDAMNRYLNSDADLIIFEPTEDTENNRLAYIRYCFNLLSIGKISPRDVSFRLTTVWSKMYKRQSIKNVRYRQTLVANDVFYAMQVAFKTRNNCIVDQNLKIYHLTTRDGSITADKARRLKKLMVRVRERFLADAWLVGVSLIVDRKLPRTGRVESVLRRFIVPSEH